ncbi:MAG TPA: aminotransferase class III-fold pyridoxal phosphate-dependent enzyme, partial [Gaiellales bacterium]|nr:aminotransferase class III-fold pyridoxal phosphate-dependent enzyme [Gaiellales bacterium]
MTSNGSQAALSDDRLQELAKRHLMMHFTRHSTFRNEDVPIITRGEGCYLYDSKGKRYFDGLAGLFCTQIGYSFGAELGEAAATQMAELPFYTNWSYAHPRSIELAAKVAELAPGDLNRAFFVSGGSEANEAIIKLVRQYHQLQGHHHRYKMIARRIAYHGTTLGALSLTG